jgi:hypothetical protein
MFVLAEKKLKHTDMRMLVLLTEKSHMLTLLYTTISCFLKGSKYSQVFAVPIDLFLKTNTYLKDIITIH